MLTHIAVGSVISVLLMVHFACSPNSNDLVKHYSDVYNTHNVDEIVSLYADDAVFEAVGQYSLSGKDQIRDHTEYYSVLNTHMSISDIETKGDTVFCNLSLTNDWLKISAIGEVHYAAVFTFEDGLIKHIRAEAKPETQQAFSEVLSPLMEWARVNQADLLTEMAPNGRFIYNGGNARKALALLRSWQESTK